MIDCGLDWLRKLKRVNPDAIVLTHAHMDHAGGLRVGAPCPVYATAETWSRIRPCAISRKMTIEPRRRFELFGIVFEAFPVEHSIQAPAVGYRITAGRKTVFYVPDLVDIPDRAEALRSTRLYIGDGASITRPIVRKRDGVRIGHASIRAQLEWCRAESVPRAIFTHCGSGIVAANERSVAEKVRVLGTQAGVEASVARDGLRLII
jgi:phosphoribosyl 1,2-cyclic phosphodiesterase